MSRIPQNQASLEGRLVLTNTENTSNNIPVIDNMYVVDVFGRQIMRQLSENDLRTDKNSISYPVFNAPVSPSISFYQNGVEVTSILVDRNSNVHTNVEIVSKHPITVSRKKNVILNNRFFNNTTDTIQSPILDLGITRFYDNTINQGFSYNLGQPRVESDGNYHYTLVVTPTENNPNSVDPIKLGDLTFTSRIYKNGTRPTEWVVVEDTDVGREIVKTLLRTDDLTIVNLGEEGDIKILFLPNIENAVPGIVYRGPSSCVNPQVWYINPFNPTNTGTTYKLFVAVPYGLTRESYGSDDLDYIESNNRYYYSQSEIDDIFGYVSKDVSVIQQGEFYYTIEGDKTSNISFLGENRQFELKVTGNNTSSRYNYTVGGIENCNITINNNIINMSVPSRIPNYSPKLISDNYYQSLTSLLPVSFNVSINSVGTKKVNEIPGINPFSTVIDKILVLDSEPIQGTSGLNTEPSDIYYVDNVTGVVKFVRNLETYTYYLGLRYGIVDYTKSTGYTYKKTTGWSSSTISLNDFPRYVQSRNTKYNLSNSTSWVPAISSSVLSSSVSSEVSYPINTDDSIFIGEYTEVSTPTSSSRNLIEVDKLPIIAKAVLPTSDDSYQGYYYKVGNKYYKFTLIVDQNQLSVFTPTTQWISSNSEESMYNELNFGINGYEWSQQIRLLLFYTSDFSPVLLSHPPANSGNYKQSHYLWVSHSEEPSGYEVQVTNSLPSTRNLVASNTAYKLGSTYYTLGSYYVCNMKPVYSVVSVSNPPELYNPSTTYSKGDLVIQGLNVWKSLVDNNSNNTPTTSESFWSLLGKIFEYTPYSSTKIYMENQTVTNNGYVWKSKQSGNQGHPTTDSDWWDEVGLYSNYRYYKVDSLPRNLTSSDVETGGLLPTTVTSSSKKYYRLEYTRSGITTYTYYRKGYNFIISPTNSSGDHGLYTETSSTTYTKRTDRFFKITINNIDYYYVLKLFAPETAIQNNFQDDSENKLLNSDYPGDVILKGDTSESGFGRTSDSVLSNYYVDFNDYTIKTQSFEEKVDLKQDRINKGIISNLHGLNSTGTIVDSSDYKLYLGQSNFNTIEISVTPDTTSIEGMVGIFNLNNVLSSTSNRVGEIPNINITGSITSYELTSPKLDGGNTNNLVIFFPKNESNSSITRNIEFIYSEPGGELNTVLRLIIHQSSDPGEVRITDRKLYFLSNGLLNSSNTFGYFTFSTNIKNSNNYSSDGSLTLDNIEILDPNTKEDLLDREASGLIRTIASQTYDTYQALLILKPNTKHKVIDEFRIKIGKILQNSITDRTLDDSSAIFYKYSENGWEVLGDDYIPTYTEDYYSELPSEGNLGEIVCICNSLRGYQGYYSVTLFNPSLSDYNNMVDFEWRSTTNLQDIINDFGHNHPEDLTINLTPEDIEDYVILNVSELPDINTLKTSGLIYKIGDNYYYTYSDFITSGYTYGTLGFPISINTGRDGQQKYHLKLEQCEYDTSGNTSITSLTDTFFTLGDNYSLNGTNWELFDTSGEPIQGINPEEVCFSRIVYSDVQNPSLIPYFESSYSFNDDASDIIIKANVNIKINYNYSGNILIDDEYKKVNNLFTLYIRRKWNNS